MLKKKDDDVKYKDYCIDESNVKCRDYGIDEFNTKEVDTTSKNREREL